MPEQKLYYVPIGFISGDIQAQNFVTQEAPKLLDANEIIRDNRLPIRLGFKTTILSERVSDEIREKVYKTLGDLIDLGVDVSVDSWQSGPTRTMFSTLFDPGITAFSSYDGSKSFRAVATGDLDQFPPNKNLEKLLELWEFVKSKEAIMGVGSRNVKVRLSAHEENGDYRRIFEGIINLAIKNTANRNFNEIATKSDYGNKEDPAYTDTGDFITGVYLTNPPHKNRNHFVESLTTTARDNNFFLFEDEYLMTLLAAQYGYIAAINMNSVENPFEKPTESVEAEKKAIFERQIQAPLQKLRNTQVAKYIRSSIREEKQILEKYYSPKVVSEVTEFMMAALSP